MKEESKNILAFFAIILIVVSLMIFFASKSQKKNESSKILLDQQAKIEMPVKYADLGEMKVSDEKSTDFEIKNIGSQPLKIFRVFTSCDCTFAKVIINSQESPEFNMEMHNTPEATRWQGEVLPNATATIRAIYKPSVMPVFGPVERNVIFSTNDPSNQQIQLTIKALVSK